MPDKYQLTPPGKCEGWEKLFEEKSVMKNEVVSSRVTRPRPIIVNLGGGRKIALSSATVKFMGGFKKVSALNQDAINSRYHSVKDGVRYN